MKIRVGSRESKLAVIQAQMIMDAMKRNHPDLTVELVTMKTTGDRILDRTLDQIGGKGLFVRELDQALSSGRVDFTVHSLKDMPMEPAPDLPLVAFPTREDPRDVLVLRDGTTELDSTAPIGCASHRRKLQLQSIYPGVEVRPIRGNLQTRLAKLDRGEYSALVLAAAGLKRLGLEHRISRYFSTEEILPAAGQGILVVQTRQDQPLDCLIGINDPASAACAQAERAFVRALGGGCTSPVAAYATVKGEKLTLTGLYVSEDERVTRKGTIIGDRNEGERLGYILAQQLKKEAEL